MKRLAWHTEQRKINDLIPFTDNPRRLTEKQFTDLKKSISKFDLAEIPAIDTDNKIIAGHQRLKVMQALDRGEETIDVRVPNRKLTDAEYLEYNLRSNKNTGEWDFGILANFDETLLDEVGFNINLGEFDPEKEWQGMPSFESDPIAEAKKILVRFMTVEDYQAFTKLIGQKLTMETKSIWYPKHDFDSNGRDLVFTNES